MPSSCSRRKSIAAASSPASAEVAPLRFFIDEDPQQELARTLGELGHDVLATREAGTKGWSDARQLDFAAAQHRVFITCNANDFGLIHDALALWSRRRGTSDPPHAGILIVPNGSRMGLAEVTRIVADFANHPDAERVAGRLFEWVAGSGWRERETSQDPS